MAADPPVLDPRLLTATRGLALTARRLVAGTVAGLHSSRRAGLAREFSQYRAYQPGDEPRHIDWKLFARSDRYFLRQSEVDTRVAVSLVLDATESMAHRGDGHAPRKLDVARAVAAALALLAEQQGDSVALHIISAGGVQSVLTGGKRQPFQRVVHALAGISPRGAWPADPTQLARALRHAESAAGSAGPGTSAKLTVVLTDGHERGGEIRAALAGLAARQHEIILFHLLSRDERDFPYRGGTRFVEWETGRAIEADAAVVRAAFLAEQQRAQAAWRRAWGGEGFDYVALATDEAPGRALRVYLRRRETR